MRQLSIVNFLIYVVLIWFIISLLVSIYSLYKVQKQIEILENEIEKYKIGYIIYTSKSAQLDQQKR
jgi:predicted membrane channel-forming protein YqfA (hemolysin III family)